MNYYNKQLKFHSRCPYTNFQKLLNSSIENFPNAADFHTTIHQRLRYPKTILGDGSSTYFITCFKDLLSLNNNACLPQHSLWYTRICIKRIFSGASDITRLYIWGRSLFQRSSRPWHWRRVVDVYVFSIRARHLACPFSKHDPACLKIDTWHVFSEETPPPIIPNV